MATQTGKAIGALLGLYGDQSKSWKADHEKAMACGKLEESIVLGIGLSNLIEAVDNDWRAEVHAGTRPYSREDSDNLDDLVKLWLALTRPLVESMGRLEADGYEIARADEFRALYREWAGAATPDAEFFGRDPGALARLRDEAVDDHIAGRAS